MLLRFSLFRWAWVWCLLLSGCIEAYVPEVTGSTRNYLVVDGFINSRGVTTIRLSRTYAVTQEVPPPTESGATLYIEEKAGTTYPLTESSGRGVYTSAALSLNPTREYRLRIVTRGGLEYASEFVQAKITPPIDQVTWRIEKQDVRVAVATHDDTNSSRYYRWEYEETWEIYSPYSPTVEFVSGKMRNIQVPFPTICWSTARTSQIRLGNTNALSQDVVRDQAVRVFPAVSERLRSKYSILVQQQALTREEYAYWELLRKNTENIGSLFDAQPAQVTGNIVCLTEPSELALGFVGVHSQTEKRIFISSRDLPAAFPTLTGYESCTPPDTVYLDRPLPVPPNILAQAFSSQSYLPIDPLYGSQGVIGYTGKARDCIDCRTRGTDRKPSFWQ